jgi:hypothetical protein
MFKFNLLTRFCSWADGSQKPARQQAVYVVRHFKQTLRLTIYISTILIPTLLLGFNLLTNPVHITGHLKRNPEDTSAYVEGIAVIVKGDNKVLTQTFADRYGNFEVTFTPDKEKSFDFFVYGIAVDTLLISSVRAFDSDTPELTFYIPALRKKNYSGQMLCPKCNKADKVYKIRYGDGLPMATQIVSETGDMTYSPIVKGHYNAGTCIVGVATYYCDRDKVRF